MILIRKRLMAMALVALLAITTACSRGAAPETGNAGQPAPEAAPARVRVVTALFPYEDIARQVGGDRVEVTNLVPPGAEPHDWEPKPGDVIRLNEAQLFVYNGAGMEPWVEKVLASLDNARLAVVEATAGMALRPAAADPHAEADHDEHEHDEHEHDEHEHDEHEHDEHGHDEHAGHDHGEFDPHVWLDPVLLQQVVAKVRDALISVDPEGRAAYEANARRVTADLAAIDQEYQALGSCQRKEIVVAHAFFGYPAARYGLEQMPIISSLSPDAEPTPKQMAELVEFAREHDVKYIFFETLVSDRVAQVIASEVGARTLLLNPIEGLTAEEAAQGKTVQDLMRANLVNLKQALECGG